jgi:hypothetical protein
MLSVACAEGSQEDQQAEAAEKISHGGAGAHAARRYVIFSDRDVVWQVCSQK